MRTKLIVGLTAGLIAAAQSGTAQSVSSQPATETFFQNSPIGTDAIAAPVAPIAAIPLVGDSLATTVTTADTAAMDASVDIKNLSDSAPMATAWNFTDFSAPQSLSVANDQALLPLSFTAKDSARRPVTAAADYTSTSTDWLNLNGETASLPAMTPGQIFSSSETGSEDAFNAPMDSGADNLMNGGAQKASYNSKGGSNRMPLLASPEPGTVSLLVMGGAAVVGAIRRRKQ